MVFKAIACSDCHERFLERLPGSFGHKTLLARRKTLFHQWKDQSGSALQRSRVWVSLGAHLMLHCLLLHSLEALLWRVWAKISELGTRFGQNCIDTLYWSGNILEGLPGRSQLWLAFDGCCSRYSRLSLLHPKLCHRLDHQIPQWNAKKWVTSQHIYQSFGALFWCVSYLRPVLILELRWNSRQMAHKYHASVRRRDFLKNQSTPQRVNFPQILLHTLPVPNASRHASRI